MKHHGLPHVVCMSMSFSHPEHEGHSWVYNLFSGSRNWVLIDINLQISSHVFCFLSQQQMDRYQVQEEKTAVQKALLHLENRFGRPVSWHYHELQTAIGILMKSKPCVTKAPLAEHTDGVPWNTSLTAVMESYLLVWVTTLHSSFKEVEVQDYDVYFHKWSDIIISCVFTME